MTFYTQKESNIRKTWVLITLFLIVIIGFGWVLSRAYNSPSILYIAVLLSSLFSVTSYWFSDQIVISSVDGILIDRKDNPELIRIVENLAITAGLPTPKVYFIPDPAPNAFATGRDADHASIGVTDGLLKILDRSELEGVLAHELSHIGNRDMLLSTVIVVLVGVISILSDFAIRNSFGRRRSNEENNNIFLVLAIVGAVLAPLAATLIQLSVSRKREFLADATGIEITRYPEGLAGALEKISHSNIPQEHQNPSAAHLWLASPFGNKSSFVSKLFMTHPPIEERIAILRKM